MLGYILRMLIWSLIMTRNELHHTYDCKVISKFKTTFSAKLPTPTFNCYHVQTRLKKSFRDLSSAFCAHQENHLVVECMTLHISSSPFIVMLFFSNQIILQYSSTLSSLSSTIIEPTCAQSSHQNLKDKFVIRMNWLNNFYLYLKIVTFNQNKELFYIDCELLKLYFIIYFLMLLRQWDEYTID